MIRGVIIPAQHIKYTPSDFAFDAMNCIDRIKADFDEIVCSPIVYMDEKPPFYEGPCWKLSKGNYFEFTFSMPFSMMREVIKNDPELVSIVAAPKGGALASSSDPYDLNNLIQDRKAMHALKDKIEDERGRFA